MDLERTLNVISQLQSVRTNIFSIYIQEKIGFGKFRTVLEGKTVRDIMGSKEFIKFRSYFTLEIQFLSGNCYIYIIDKSNLF